MSIQAEGSQSKVVIATETTYNTPDVTASSQTIPFHSTTLGGKRNEIKSTVIRSTRNPNKPVRGNVDVSGDLAIGEFNAYQTTLLKHLMGDTDTDPVIIDPYTTAYKHTFKIGTLPTGLTVETQFTDIGQYVTYSGCKVSSAKFSLKPEGFVDFAVTLMGAEVHSGTSTLLKTPTDFGHLPFDSFSAVVEEDGDPLGIVTGLDFTINNNPDGNTYTVGGAGIRKSVIPGIADVSGTVSILFEDLSLYNKAVDYTESAIVLTLSCGTGNGTSSNEKVVITLPELVFAPQTPAISGPTGLTITMPFTCFYNDNADATAAMIECWNTQETLY